MFQADERVSKMNVVLMIRNDIGEDAANSGMDFAEQLLTGPLLSVPTTLYDRKGSCNLFHLM